MTIAGDPFGAFKAAQREGWAAFGPVEIFTVMPAAKLVKFAEVAAGQRVLDVGCGTGVVAITAARRGAKVCGLDLTPNLVELARHNASVAGVDVEFHEGDAEALPYEDASFDVVLSQFGHIFAPRPALALREMLRVLKVGGRGSVLDVAARAFHRANVHVCPELLAEVASRVRSASTSGPVGRSKRRAGAAWQFRERHQIPSRHASHAYA